MTQSGSFSLRIKCKSNLSEWILLVRLFTSSVRFNHVRASPMFFSIPFRTRPHPASLVAYLSLDNFALLCAHKMNCNHI